MITQLSKRKQYRVTQKKKKLVKYVNYKSQSHSVDFLTLLQAAERFLTHELHRLFEIP